MFIQRSQLNCWHTSCGKHSHPLMGGFHCGRDLCVPSEWVLGGWLSVVVCCAGRVSNGRVC